MNDAKKKKIYTAVIVVCILVTGYMLYTLYGSGGAAEDIIPQTPAQGVTPTQAPSAGTSAVRGSDPSVVEFTAPAVFPSDSKFQSQVLNSAKYQTLTPYDKLQVSPEELHRDDPFAPIE